MNFNFGEVLTRAWQIIWKHKVLWVFGILASCGRGGSSGGGNTSFDTQGPDLPPRVMQWFNTIEQNMATIIAVSFAVICIIWILAIFLSTIGRIGLIRGTFQADSGEEKLIFGQLFSESMPYFWRMFGLLLIFSLPILILVGALIAGVLVFVISAVGGNDASVLGIFALIPFMIGCLCLLIPVMFVVGMIIRQSQNAIVLEDMAVMPSLSRGWEIFRGNLGPIIIMAIILAILGFVAGIVIALPILLVVLPAALAFTFGNGDGASPIIFMVVCVCLYFPVALVLQGILTSYIESAWTLTYLRITLPKQDDDDATILEANA
ncbi:MAG: hypothetical protein R3307_06940 [Anaerolineales bacterium]|nr:hypothetical protein [Anaerolineales bacterium]